MRRNRLALMFAPALLAVAAGCNSSESQGPKEDHTPVTYTLLVDGVELPQPYTFVAGQTIRVQVKLFNAANEDLDHVESSHFAGLTFDPTSLATTVRVAGHNFQFDVTGGTAGTGTLAVSFGHDTEADELAFDAVAATVIEPSPITVNGRRHGH